MRIHELLEACLEYVVVEGVLGSDPLVVRAHLQTLDSNVDDAYFAHLWPLLARHECTEVVVAADALPGVGGAIPAGVPATDVLQDDLFRVLGDDDGGAPPVPTGDLAALLERYPARVRLRCTEDEIYYRLTGSRKRIPKITPTIFTYLQLAARSREQGISALELGPMTDTTQNSAFHYIKVLVQLGLCVKIPASMHGSSTSVLVYRRFLEQNPHYRALKARDSGQPETGPATPAMHGEVDSEEAKTYGAAQDLGFHFAPFSELELVAGRIPKERLCRVLDHPGLKNHLLGNHHLLQVIGWPDDTWQVRHRRQLQRHITTLIEDGVVEYVDIGTSARACLRLTKYNPDFTPVIKAEPETAQQKEKEVPFSPADYEQPFQITGGASATQSIESQILTAIADTGLKGCTLADVHKQLSSMFKRTLEHVVNRHDLAYLPPHLQHHAIRCVIESHQRVRRLRVFTSGAYLKYMEQLGQPLEPVAESEEQGRYADVSFRGFATSPDDYYAETEEVAAAIVPVGKQPTGRPRKGRARGKGVKGSKAARTKTPATKIAEPVHSSPIRFKYDNDVQERGRPRKYVFIVNTDGTRNRNIIGNLLASPNLPAVLIYDKDEDVIVEAPPGYTGVGEPPKLTEEQLAAGLPPAHYRTMSDKKGKARGRGKGRKKKGGPSEDDDDTPPSPTVHRTAKRQRTAAHEEGKPEEDLPMTAEGTPTGEALALAVAEEVVAEQPGAGSSRLSAEVTAPPLAPALAALPEPEPEPETPTRTKRPRRAAARGALSALSRSATPDTSERAPKRPRRSTKAALKEPTPSPAPVIDPALDNEGSEAAATAATAAPTPDVPAQAALLTPAAHAQTGREPSDTPLTPLPTDGDKLTEVDAAVAIPPEAQSVLEGTPVVPAVVPDLTPKEEEPLKSVLDDTKQEASETEARSTPRVVRVDIAVLRRANEIYQCLLDTGRVLSDQKLYVEQKNWSHKYAGTNHPNAPQVGASMDRKVFKRMVNRLKDDGRIKEHIATIPTTTGRWINVPVLYISDTDESEVKTYIRTLANAIAPPGSPVPSARSKSALEYSAYRRAAPRSSLRVQSSTPQASPGPSAPQSQIPPGMTQREAILAEPTMAAYLYGFQSGRCLRTMILHTALVEAFTSNIESKSIVCRSPRVFALPFVFEDLRVRDYFSFVQVRGYDEELYQWLKMPGNRDMRLRDIPPEIAEKASLTGRGSSGAKSMIRTLLSMLSFLQLITLLVPCEEADAVVHCSNSPDDHIGHFARGNDISTTTYFLLHDVVPIYNINDASLPCLGFMPSKNPAEVDVVWKYVKHASLEQQAPFIRRIEVPPFPYAPDISGVLDMTIDHPKTLRGRNRWRHEIRLIPLQRKNLDATIDPTLRQRTVTDPADVEKLAYNNGLQPSYVEVYLNRRVHQMQGGAPQTSSGPRLPSEKAAAVRVREREKRQKQKEAIRDELAARIRAARKVYDERVRAAATRAGVEVDQELLDYITHNRPMSRLGEIASDAELSAIIESFIRVKSGYAPVRRTHVRPAPAAAKGSPFISKRAAAAKRPPTVKNPNVKLRRYRHNWTKEDEELLIDAEAVIRARCRGTNNRGRLAMTQVFPSIGDQVLRTKLKKLLEQPGRDAYYHRLEEAFYHLWVEYRGSPVLPDNNPTSHTDFDLKRHVEFLREKVNKNLLKLPVPSNKPNNKDRAPDLPPAPIDVATVYTWEYLKSINTSMDQLVEVTTAAEDTRLNNISLASIVSEEYKPRSTESAPLSRTQGVIRAVLKMIVGTPTEIYSAQDASRVLSAPRALYEPQIAALVNEQVLLKHMSGSARQIPGRMYGFTTQWLQQSDNLLPADVEGEVDAALARFANPAQTAAPWPLIGTGGDLAALMTMVSNHEAEFDIDLSNLPTLRTNRLQYNTRALNDDAFEFDFSVTRTGTDYLPKLPLPVPREFPRLCTWPETPATATVEQVATVIAAVSDAGVDGLDRGTMSHLPGMTIDVVDAVLAQLALEDEPRVFWAGYDNARLVLRRHWPAWSATVTPREPGHFGAAPFAKPVPTAARRWVDIWGDLVTSDWQRALKLVIGAITTRPGLTEASLRARVSPFLDRLEVCDVLQYLVDSGVMTRRLSIPAATHRPLPPVHATDTAETPYIVWLPDPTFLWSPVSQPPFADGEGTEAERAGAPATLAEAAEGLAVVHSPPVAANGRVH